MNSEISIIPIDGTTAVTVEENLSAINYPLSNFLKHYNLPTENIFSPIEERRKVITSLGSVLELLSLEKREQANYLSSFTISISLGMFDGALAFLWDETIRALRKMIVDFDLHYFYSIAENMSKRYKGLSTAEEIEAISEHDLLEISRRIGLLNNVNHKRLETVNYFRNHTSSAHPNEHELSGLELISFLENCIKYAINANYDVPTLELKRLLENIRHNVINESDVPSIIDNMATLQQERIHDFTLSLFGLYTDTRQIKDLRDNIDKLSTKLWELLDEDIKYKIGSKYGFYRVHSDIERKDLVQRFLENVNGNSYKDEDSLASELIEKLQNLRTAHYGSNNFYNEYPHAESINNSLPSSNIPMAAKKDFVKTISTSYIGNGLGYYEGVDKRALPYYEKFIDERFHEDEIKIFIKLFQDHEFISDFQPSNIKIITRVKKLINILITKTENTFIVRLLNILKDTSRLDKVATTTEFKDALINFS
ncbi:MAG TPA: hypothetical protein EYG85_06900 [Crocinitomix sp.]|nr:hypothetical protein [Crocinitomix sp.]